MPRGWGLVGSALTHPTVALASLSSRPAENGIDSSAFLVTPQKTGIFSPQTMGSLDPQAVVRFCVFALALFTPTPEEER